MAPRVVALGGGHGLAMALRAIRSYAGEVIGVEPEHAACFSAALAAGKPIDVEVKATLADGLAVSRVGPRSFDVARALVDRPRHFAALNADDANVHVRRRDGRCQGLVPVPDEQNDIGSEPLELARELNNAEAYRLRHRSGIRSFQLKVDLAVDIEAILPDDPDR